MASLNFAWRKLIGRTSETSVRGTSSMITAPEGIVQERIERQGHIAV